MFLGIKSECDVFSDVRDSSENHIKCVNETYVHISSIKLWIFYDKVVITEFFN